MMLAKILAAWFAFVALFSFFMGVMKW